MSDEDYQRFNVVACVLPGAWICWQLSAVMVHR